MAAKKNKVVATPKKTILNNRYERGGSLGSGAFGTIYKAFDTKLNKDVAIKAENLTSGHDQLPKEYAVYKKIGSVEGFLKSQDFFIQGDNQFLVFTLVGASLEKVMHSQNNKKLDLKSTLMIAIQLIRHIRSLHEKHYLHRDIKPDNMAFGIGDEAGTLYMLDLGLGKEYIRGGHHIYKAQGKSLVGTARYASLNSHIGCELSRRDDLESIAYVLIYLMKGSLPWQGYHADNSGSKYTKVYNKKVKTTTTELCSGLEPEFRQFLKYSRKRKFEEEPDYDLCIGMFETCMRRNNLVYDDIYPWTKDTDPAAVKLKKAKEAEEERLRRAALLLKKKKMQRKFKFPATTVDKFFSDNCGLTLAEKQAIIRKNMLEGAAFPTLAPPMFPPPSKEIAAADEPTTPLADADVEAVNAPQSLSIVPALSNGAASIESGEIVEIEPAQEHSHATNESEVSGRELAIVASSPAKENDEVPKLAQAQAATVDESHVQEENAPDVFGDTPIVPIVLEKKDVELLTTDQAADDVNTDTQVDNVHQEPDSADIDSQVVKVVEAVDSTIKKLPQGSNELAAASKEKPAVLEDENVVEDNGSPVVQAPDELPLDTVAPLQVISVAVEDVPMTNAPAAEEKKIDEKPTACAVVAATKQGGNDNSKKKKKKNKKRKATEIIKEEQENDQPKKTRKQQQADMIAMVEAQAKQEAAARARFEAEQKRHTQQNYYQSYIHPNHHLPAQPHTPYQEAYNSHQSQAPPYHKSTQGTNYQRGPALPHYQANNYQMDPTSQHHQVNRYQMDPALQHYPANDYQRERTLPRFQQRQAPYMNRPLVTFNPQFGIPGQQQLVHQNTSVDSYFLF